MSAVRQFVKNPVAANVLMLLLLLGGLLIAMVIPREMFPEFSVDIVTVTVVYPGASPDDIQESICDKIEGKLEGISGIDDISSTSRTGIGTVVLELNSWSDSRKVLDEVQAAVDSIEFPENAEDPVVMELTTKEQVISVAIAGNTDDGTLKELAEKVRDDIVDLPGVSQAVVSGVAPREIIIEVKPAVIRQYDLTLAMISRKIREDSTDLPAGSVKTKTGEISIRLLGKRRQAQEFRNIVMLTNSDGGVVTLDNIANIIERGEETDVAGLFNSQPTALVTVFNTSEEDAIAIAAAVKKYVIQAQLDAPEGITYQTWADMSVLIEDRLDMLVGNGIWGLVLVFLVLWFFLGYRLSFWVAMGIPVSILGTFIVLKLTGQSLNMISMFALIMALGLIVDDAIVVGENIFAKLEGGLAPADAAVKGAHDVLWPVIGAVATTWLAFSPLLFLDGIMGKFIRILPFVVMVALAFSLLECLLILPAHLAHSLKHRPNSAKVKLNPIRKKINAGIKTFINNIFLPFHKFCVRNRYITMCTFFAIIAISVGAMRGGHIKVVAFPAIDSDYLTSTLVMPGETGIAETRSIAKTISSAAKKLNEQFETKDGSDMVKYVYASLGSHVSGGGHGAGASATGSHLSDVMIELTPAENRTYTSQEILVQWRKNTGQVNEAESLVFGVLKGGPGGKAIAVKLSGPSIESLKEPAAKFKKHLATFGVSDLEDDALPGKDEMKIRLKPRAQTLGVTREALSQVRDAFYGRESLTIQRGTDEIKVMVRYPAKYRASQDDVESMRVITSSGQVPFGEVAYIERGQDYATLRKINGSSVITIQGEIDEGKINSSEIIKKLSEKDGFVAKLEEEFPGVKVEFGGQSEQMAKSFSSLIIWLPLALVGIYAILATIFKSYFQPIIIMLAIPMGLLGAIIGHAIMGMPLTFFSMFGMVALTGIVVNDSLVLMDLVNRRIQSGMEVFEAVYSSARDRFRPIILTTITTVVGMAPILLEQSFQAQFLKPMVVSISFGLMFATTLTLIVVPSLYIIGWDIKPFFAWKKLRNPK